MIPFSPRLIAYALAACLSLGLLYSAYSWSYDRGYSAANAKYTAIMVKQEKALDAKLQELLVTSQELAAEEIKRQALLDKSLLAIVSKVSKQPLVIYKEGVCTPTEVFSNSFGEIASHANKSMKGLDK